MGKMEDLVLCDTSSRRHIFAHMQNCVPSTKLQYTAFRKASVPKLRMKAAVTRHLLPVLLKMIEIHFPPRDDQDRRIYLSHAEGILQLVGEEIVEKGARTAPRALRTLHVACAGSICSLAAVAAMAPEAEASRNASRVRPDREPSTVLELRRRICDWLGQQRRRDNTCAGIPRALVQKFLVWLDTNSGLVGRG